MTPLAVPLSIRIFHKCTLRGIPAELIRHMHFFDLQCLLMRFDIDDAVQYLEQRNKDELHKQGIAEVRDIDGTEALRFLGR